MRVFLFAFFSRALTKLNLRENSIGDEGAVAIADALRVNEVLTNLVLLNNNIGDEGAAALASALRVNGVLKTLDLRYNGIGNEGAAALGKALEVDGVLNTLYIGSNKIGDEGAKAIGGALAVNGVLTDLNLSYNGIRDEGAIALGKALEVNGVLTDLNLCRATPSRIGGGTGWIKASEVEGESKEVGAKVIYQGREMVVSRPSRHADGVLVDAVQTGVLAIAKALEVNAVADLLGRESFTEEMALGAVRVELGCATS